MADISVHKEVEVKLELSYADFTRLLKECQVDRCIEQLNVYYDQDSELAERASTFRIRLSKTDSPKVTLKVPTSQAEATREAMEVEGDLSAFRMPRRTIDVGRDLPPAFRSSLRSWGVDSLRRVGWMRTSRYIVQLWSIGPVELDEVELPGGQLFFEVEFESDDDALRGRLVESIRQFADSARPSRQSKYERFVAAVGRPVDAERQVRGPSTF